MTYTAARVGHIALVPRNHVQVHMLHGLPGRSTDVDADVPAVGFVVARVHAAHGFDDCKHLGPLSISGIEQACDVSPWNDQRVSPGDRECIEEGPH